MAISVRASGTWAVATTQSPTVTIPAGYQAGDLGILVSVWRPYTVTATVNQSWTEIVDESPGTTGNGVGVGSSRLFVAYKVLSASETDPTITRSGSITPGGQVIVVLQADGGWDVAAISAAVEQAMASTAMSHNLTTTDGISSGDWIWALTGVADDSATFTRATTAISGGPSWSGNVVEYPATHASSTTGNDMAADLIYRVASSTVSSGQTITVTATLSAAERVASVLFRVRETWDLSGDTSASHSSSTSASGSTGRAGTASVSHATSTSATGVKGGRGTTSATHASSTTAVGGGSGSLQVSHSSSVSVQGAKGASGEITVAHASATSATGEKGGSFDFSGSFTVDLTSSTSAQGAKEGRGSASTAQASSVTAQGSTGRQGEVSVSSASATSAAGSRASAGVLSVSLVSVSSGTGAKGSSGAASIDHASSSAATGSAAEAHAGTWTISLASGISSSGQKGSDGSLDSSLASSVGVLGVSGRQSGISSDHTAGIGVQGEHAGASTLAILLASTVAVTGVRVALPDRPGIEIGEGVSLGTTIRDQGTLGGRASDRERLTVGVRDG